jgi:malonate-semialdehyde dehydrogenase (acetylating)/methylmalonate-semialdehyde dehydrogenase
MFMTTSNAVSDVVPADRYYLVPSDAKPEVISGACAKKLKYGVGGAWKESKTGKYMPCYDPSTGAVIAYAPQCTAEEVEEAIEAAVKAFPAWRDTPVTKRIQVLFKMKQLLDEHLDELTHLCAQEEVGRGDGRCPQGD